jgi:hypothetical protein
MCKFSLNILLLLSLWLVYVSLQIQYHNSTTMEQEQKRYKEAIFKGISFISCLIVNSMIKSQGKSHVLSCFFLDLGGSREINLCLHSLIYLATSPKSGDLLLSFFW